MIPKPLILAVETSGRAGSAAIAIGEQILAEAAFSGPMRHSAEIFPTVSALLKDLGRKPKEIEHIYISIGPGSFTGLRIAVTIAKTFNLANNAKIVPVDTLDVIAANVTTENTLPTSSHEPPASSIEHRAYRRHPRRKTQPILHRPLPAQYERQATSNERWNLGKSFPGFPNHRSAIPRTIRF